MEYTIIERFGQNESLANSALCYYKGAYPLGAYGVRRVQGAYVQEFAVVQYL